MNSSWRHPAPGRLFSRQVPSTGDFGPDRAEDSDTHTVAAFEDTVRDPLNVTLGLAMMLVSILGLLRWIMPDLPTCPA